MRQIPLSQGLVALVDDADFERVNQYKWCAKRAKVKRNIYAMRKDAAHKSVLLHRFIVDASDDVLVDHRDGNGLNCQRDNLRQCSFRQNNQNRPKQSNNRSGYKGIMLLPHGRYRAVITLAGKKVQLGYFDTAEEAARAYDAAAREIHGEFARLNFPDA